jgi:hypothetical protein
MVQFVRGHHLPDGLISESPASLDISRCEQNGWFSRASSCGLKRTCDRRLSQSVSTSALVDDRLVHRIREHCPTPELQHRRPAPIGKTAVSDNLSLCPCFITGRLRAVNENRKVNCSRLAPSVARQPVYNSTATALVYIIVVSGKIARPALPLFVPLHCTCGICLLPFHISPISYSSLPGCPRSRRTFRLLTQRLNCRHRTGSSRFTFPQRTKLMT